MVTPWSLCGPGGVGWGVHLPATDQLLERPRPLLTVPLPRAAAYSKLGNYVGAVQDCERAIGIDPAYSKAYGRMG